MNQMSREKRLIENEVIFRDVNKNIQEFIEEDTNISTSEPIDFYCECSNPKCIERISITPHQYETYHKTKKQFIVLIGHEFLEVERVIKRFSKFQIVEKHISPPKAEDIDLALKNISATVSAPASF